MTMDELIEKYKLSEEEHNRVLQMLKEYLFLDYKHTSTPSIMFVVGQPGCGKTTYIKSSNLSDYTIINSDDYRCYSKYSKEILAKYPTDYAKLTNYDAHLWGDELFSYALQKGYRVLREKAPLDYSLLEVIKSIPQNYDITINVVVTDNLSSLLATRERYEKEILENENAKLSNIESHNKCYELLPEFIFGCLSLGIKVNYIVPINDEFELIPVGEDYLNLLQQIRKESLNHTYLTYNSRIENIKKSMINRNASLEQFDELSKIERIYMLTNTKKHL